MNPDNSRIWLRRLDTTKANLTYATGVLGLFFTLELSLHSGIGLYSTFLISQLGPEHLSATAISISVYSIVFSLLVELGTGLTTMVARRMGEGTPGKAATVIGQALVLFALLAVPISIIGTWATPYLLNIFGAEGVVLDLGIPYLRLFFAATILLLPPFLLSAALRAVGNPVMVTIVQIQELVTQLVLMPILIFGAGSLPRLGILGSLLALVIARIISLVILLWSFFNKNSEVALTFACIRPRLPIMRQLLALSIPAAGQPLARSGAEAIIIRLVAGHGMAAIAGYTISQRLLLFLETVGRGVGNAAFTVVGQNLGARQGSRATLGTRIAVLYSLIVMGIGIFFLVGWAPAIVAAFSSDQDVVTKAIPVLRLVGGSYIFMAISLTLTRAFHGAGDTVSPVVIEVLALWVIQIPLAIGFTVAGFGTISIWTSIAVAYAIRGIILAIWFRWSRRMQLAFSIS